MNGESFEYAIKKDVRNNAIVREIDRERHREMWRMALIGVFVAAVLVFTVWRHGALLVKGYEFDEIRTRIATVEEQNRLLEIELETMRAPALIEVAAKTRGMVEPGMDDRIVITRVVPSPPPPGSVVARR